MFLTLHLAAQSAATISTVAGTGTGGYSGDGAAATAAQLNDPHGVALDSAGNLYIADQSNHRVRRIDTAGVITTFAGTGTGGYGGDGSAATSAWLNLPRGMTVDGSGNLYIAIRKTDASARWILPRGTYPWSRGAEARFSE